MDEVLQAIETLVVNNCLTLSEALEKTYLAGHRKAAKELESKSIIPGGFYVSSSPNTPPSGHPPV